MKIVWCDSYDRENIADRLVAENVKSKEEAEVMLEALRASVRDSGSWYKLVEDDYRLSRGMEDLV